MNPPYARPRWSATLKDFAAFGPRRRMSAATLTTCPAGDGSAVLVLPGILHSDAQTELFRTHITTLGYQAFGWEQGLNTGPSRQLMEGVTQRLTRLAGTHGSVRLVGFSMGGLFARWLAHRRSSLVRQVVTVVTPFRDPIDATWFPVRPFLWMWRDVDIGALSYMVRQPPPLPWGALYSRQDGIVAWQSCLDVDAPERCLEVTCRHRMAHLEWEVFQGVAGFLGDV